MRAVLLDVGGVLLLPPPDEMALALRAGGVDPDPATLERAHYRAIGMTDRTGRFDLDLYRRSYAMACGVPQELVGAAVEAIGRRTIRDWDHPIAGSAGALGELAATGLPMGVVSNAMGTVAAVLAAAGLCQVGAGPGVTMSVILDSAEVGVEKPDPRIFRMALEAIDVPPERALYVGDTARVDIDGARAVGMRPVHFDPFGDCPDAAGDHEHVGALRDVLALL